MTIVDFEGSRSRVGVKIDYLGIKNVQQGHGGGEPCLAGAKGDVRPLCPPTKTTRLDLLHCELLHEFRCYDTASRIHSDFHTADLLVDILHELNNKVHELVLPHAFEICVSDEETHVVIFGRSASHNHKVLGTLHKKPCEFVTQDLFDFIGLLDFNAYSDGVDGGLDETVLVLRASYAQRIEQELLVPADLHLGLVVSLNVLRREILQTYGGSEGQPHSIQVRLQSTRLEI